MTRPKVLALLGITLMLALLLFFHYLNDFRRVKRVEIETTSVQLGTIGNVMFKNNSSSKVEFLLQCQFKVRGGGRPILSEVVSLPPSGSVEFDINPELARGALPRMIPNKGCEAIWRGPFGIKRSAWWLTWQYARPAFKSEFE